jgi:outer membrane immunogenic protein
MRRHLLAILAVMACAMSPAAAADMPIKTPAPPPPVYNWTGFYIGGHFGAGWMRNGWSDGEPSCLPLLGCSPSDLGMQTAVGVLGGAQAGFNWQAGHWLLGVEGEYSAANLRGNHTNTFNTSANFPPGFEALSEGVRVGTEVRDIGTIAARIGLTSDALDRTLFYVKGGAAVARNKYTANDNGSFFGCSSNGAFSCGGTLENSTLEGRQTRWGWLAGIGLEYGLFDNLSAKVEYDYLDFGSKTVSLSGIGCSSTGGPTNCSPFTQRFSVSESIHMVEFGLNYRLNTMP